MPPKKELNGLVLIRPVSLYGTNMHKPISHAIVASYLLVRKWHPCRPLTPKECAEAPRIQVHDNTLGALLMNGTSANVFSSFNKPR